jgi:sugar transferase (PEP-CTERM/EpsH1 system associated)
MKSSESPLQRVAHVSFGLDVGGQEKLLVELARHVNRDRFAMTFVSLGHRGAVADELEACGASVVALENPSGLKPGLILRLARLFGRLRPSVVHTHDNRALVYGVPAARLARVPRVIHTRHGRNAGSTPRQVGLVRLLCRLVDEYVCVSRDAEALSLLEGIPAAKLRTIYNGIDLERFAFSGPCTEGPVVTVARLSPEKGVDNLVRAASIAMQQVPELLFQVAGDGPCLVELRQMIAELGLAGKLSLLGMVRDIPDLLARVCLFVLPSRSEGVSLTLLEAMARGLPVVATRVGGTPEVVEDGVTGLLVPSEDLDRLAEAILQLRCNPETAKRMGEEGRRRVESLFDVRRMVADYEALYSAGSRPYRPSSPVPKCNAVSGS